MTTFFTEEQVVSTVTRLTRRKLVRYIEGGVVKPQKASDGFVFAQIDIARLELLCDLTDDLNLDETALDVVVSLIDQLHTVRQDLASLARAIDRLSPETQAILLSELKSP
tara:strand:+ start:4329 stop:4658 length:330 start_codon:yes stop_codon:yes gene_type:complete